MPCKTFLSGREHVKFQNLHFVQIVMMSWIVIGISAYFSTMVYKYCLIRCAMFCGFNYFTWIFLILFPGTNCELALERKKY